MQHIKFGELAFPVIGQIERKSGEIVPLIDIPMMSDERWQQLATENAVNNFRRRHGREPETVQEALDVQRELIARLDREHEREGGRHEKS